jgi:hypothetical protein
MTTTETTAEQAATEIRRAYNTRVAQYGRDHNDGWIPVGELVLRVDHNHDQLTAGIRHLVRSDRQFTAAPQSYTGLRTPLDDEYAVWVGGQWKHTVAWE